MVKLSEDYEHKTIFVLDHGPYMKESSNQMVDFDISTKSRPPGIVPLAPVSKSIWSNCVEALFEYCRIVWDIFPCDRLLRFIVSDSTSSCLNSWSVAEQTTAHLMKSLADVGPPLKKSDSSVMLGLVSAVEAMCEITDNQKKLLSEGQTVSNCGRIICITQLKNDTHCKALSDCVADAKKRHSDLAEKSDGLLPISSIQLILIQVKPFGSDCCITEKDFTPLSSDPRIFLETHDVKATRHGIAIANRLLNLVRRHYDLSVTSITGIPMKEEQHANSSANYDVLLLHRRLPGTPLVEPERSSWDSELSSTMLLKWCTPKIDVNELFYCTGAARISPVDVNSRPSLCLTNFLLNGRSVSLEHWIKDKDGGVGSSARASGSRTITHMISCKGSDIFLHALGVHRCPFEDPPILSDGLGGKVTDYRVNDFCEIVKKSLLLPLADHCKDGMLPLVGAATNIEKITRCFPLTLSKTILFNMTKAVSPILELMPETTLSSDDVLSCQRVIYHLVSLERDGAHLPVTSHTNSRSAKHGKREDQYKSMWIELEAFLRAHADTSPNHHNILDCFLECTGGSDMKNGSFSKAIKNGDDKKRSGLDANEIFESPESPPPVKKLKVNSNVGIGLRPQKGAQSLLAMWTQRVENINSQRHVEFYGRLASDGNKARLYPNIDEESGPSNSNQTGGDRQRHGHRFSHHHYRSGAGNRDDGNKSGRNTPQGKQKMMKKGPKNY